VAIHYSDELPKALETAGGIFRALPLLGPDPFLVVNGDVLTDYPFARLDLAATRDAHLVLVPNPPQHPRGDFGLVDGAAVEAAPERFTYSGIAVYRPEFFTGCQDGTFPLKPLLLRAMAAGRCSAELYRGVWEDVGTPARLEALNLVACGHAPGD
jgi:MurNAc alpha-1-phosphate uridylyltransferase